MSAPRKTAFRRAVDELGKRGQRVIENKPDRHANVQCPLPGHEHGDRRESLSITWIEGSILIVCHCSGDQTYLRIADWLGWPAGELLHDDPSGKMTYPYSDGSRVVRSYDDQGEKTFRHYGRKPGERTVLYHLERITEARSKGEPIFLVGSEKDVHALESLGPNVYATCAPMGEGNWKHVDHRPLHGMEVIAIAHRDAQGTRWAQAVQVDLEDDCKLGFALPAVDREKADAADHIAEDYSLAQLVPWVPPDIGPDSQVDHHIDLHDQRVQDELRWLRVRTEARHLFAAEERGTVTLPPIIRLDEFLATPDEEVTYLIDDIWPRRGKILFSAQHKTGKTTARDNIVRSLADGVPFLGKFEVRPIIDGTIVVIDNELDEHMMRRWLRSHGIRHQYRVAVLPMQGRVSSFDLLNPEIRSQWAAHLKAMEPTVVLLDCLRAFLDALGLNEDKDAGRWLVAFDELLWEAGVDHAMVVHHMGHLHERSRGDSRLVDWPTAIWKLVKKDPDDPMAPRWFSAYGRDSYAAESQLSYDSSTRHLTIIGGSRQDAAADEAWPLIREYMATHPDSSQNAIEKELKAKHEVGHTITRRSLTLAVSRKEVAITVTGPGLANLHRLIEKEGGSPTSPDLAGRTGDPPPPPRHLAYIGARSRAKYPSF